MNVTFDLDDSAGNQLTIDVGDADLTQAWTGSIVDLEPRSEVGGPDPRPRTVPATAVDGPMPGATITLTVEGTTVTGRGSSSAERSRVSGRT